MREQDRLRAYARAMRREPTEPERRLWRILRAKRLEGFKFRRQVTIGSYIADFACLSKRLIVEADGWQHGDAHDAVRDAWLRSQGFKVLRFGNQAIVETPEGVVRTILLALEGGAPPLPPRLRLGPSLPRKGGGVEGGGLHEP